MNHEQIAESCRHWAAQMHRAASAVEAESDGSMQVAAVIDGNRAVAETLAQAAEAVAELARLREALAIKTALLDEAPKNMAKLARIAAILEPLRALEAAATKGPVPEAFLYWAFRHSGKHDVDWYCHRDGTDMTDEEVSRTPSKSDASLYAAARNALPALLREIQETP